MPQWIGVDPGASGGIVAIGPTHTQSTSLEGMDHYEIRNWLECCIITNGGRENIYACIERVSGFIGGEDSEGTKMNVAAAHKTFVLGESYGALDMALVCARITRIHVLPKMWQKAMGVDKHKGESKTQHKNRMKKLAQELHPEGRITLALSDALLIAHYCKSLRW